MTAPLKKFSVMVVEDDLVTSIALCKALRVGVPDVLVLTAYTIAEAKLKLQEYTVNFFILDVNLPDGSGIDFIFDVTVNNPDARIVLMTNTPLPEYRDRAEAFGVMHFLAKPVENKNLVGLIQESRATPGAVSSEETAGFQAALSRLTALDIIQLKCLNSSTQVVAFKSVKHGSGRVHFDNGEIIHAETECSQGMAALSEIIRWRGGVAEEAKESSPVEKTISGPWQSVLLTAAHAADEKEPTGGQPAP